MRLLWPVLRWCVSSIFGIDDALVGGIIGAAGGIGGAAINSAAQASANETNVMLAREGQEFNKAAQHRQLDFQERMSNTAVQRRMKDLEAAGINPMLAMSQEASSPSGGGASAPVGSVESTRPGAMISEGVKGAIGTAMDVAKFDKELKEYDANINLKNAEAVTEQFRTADIRQSANLKAQEYQARPDPNIDRAARESTARLEKVQADLDRKAADLDAVTKRVGNILGAASSAKGMRGLIRGRSNSGGLGVDMSMPDVDKVLRRHWEWKNKR